MAIYSFNAGIVKRSTGQSVTAAAAYRAGERITDERMGLVHDYTRKGDVHGCEIILPAGAPAWMSNRSQLWNAVELAEKRQDAQLARKLMLALPAELNGEQNRHLVRSFVQETFVDYGMVADVAYHALHSHNPHAHVLLTLRRVEHEKFGKKERAWNEHSLLDQWREQWEKHANRALEKAGFDVRIDHRTLKEQGLDRIPQIHVGPNVAEMTEKGIATDRQEIYDRIEHVNQESDAVRDQLEAINQEIAELEYALSLDAGEEIPAEERLGKTGKGRSKKTGGDRPVPDVDFLFPADDTETIRLSSSEDGNDRTLVAIKRQLQTLNASMYELSIIDRQPGVRQGQRLRRLWTQEEIQKSLPWLKRMNAQGNDIMIRPSGKNGTAVIGGLKRAEVETMRLDGFAPALLLQTAPGTFEAWVKLAEAGTDASVLQQASQQLARRYGGYAMKWGYGHLAGLTNRNHSSAPYVLVEEWGRGQAWHCSELLQHAQERNDRERATAVAATVLLEKETPTAANRIAKQKLEGCLLNVESRYSSEQESAECDFFAAYEAFRNRFGVPKSFERTDWIICRAMAMGGYSSAAIKGALRRYSPNQLARETGNFEQYVTRMVQRIMKRPEVVAARQERLNNLERRIDLEAPDIEL